jgi:hypothetical protein
MRIGFGRRWAAAGLAMAACMALGFFVPRFLDRPDNREQIADQVPRPSSKTIDVSMASVERTTMLQHVDRGSATLDSGQPARRISQQRIERYRWVDPQTNAQYEYVAPSEQDLLIQMHRQ